MTSVIHPRWPAERFFWSVVDAPGWKASGVLPAALLEKFGEELPVDVTTVHAVGMPMGDGTVLACGVSIDELANLDPGALSLAPMDFPAFVNAADGPLLAEQLNLLVGVWEPRPIRQARMRGHVFAAATMAACGLLMAVGFSRRAAHDEASRSFAASESKRVLSSVLPGGTIGTLEAELRKVEFAAGVQRQVGRGADAGIALADLLRGWPKDVPSKPQAIAVTPSSATVSVAVEGDPSPFLRAFKGPDGWAMAEPRLNAADNITRLTLQFQPAKNGATP